MTAPARTASRACDSAPAETAQPDTNAAEWAAIWSTLPQLCALPPGLRILRKDSTGRFMGGGDAVLVRVTGNRADVLDQYGMWTTLGREGVWFGTEGDVSY